MPSGRGNDEPVIDTAHDGILLRTACGIPRMTGIYGNCKQAILANSLAHRGPAGTSMRYEASFKPQSGGMEQTFRLDAQQYHALTVGDKGTLSYKGTRFVSFVGEQ